MHWINVEDEKPKGYEMVILDTDKGIAVGCFDPFGEPKEAIFGFTGTVTYSMYEVKRWMPLPKK
ncbi:hypothetical protein UYSO10_3922 [Kosakonia radicincitans]|uniref:hypothetical protein n=1 Tax=Kosakonia radicincitans TaxID=283686 RepID=UPI001183375F|nr:hypothetical protein [Kosakonia radicincitans]VVT52205.1 hypothetical protein UYSO10_3922 [Kosakonia radicincitans]